MSAYRSCIHVGIMSSRRIGILMRYNVSFDNPSSLMRIMSVANTVFVKFRAHEVPESLAPCRSRGCK